MSCRACDRSNSSIDVRHNMTASAVYQLPFGPGKQFFDAGLASKILAGWELAGIAVMMDVPRDVLDLNPKEAILWALDNRDDLLRNF